MPPSLTNSTFAMAADQKRKDSKLWPTNETQYRLTREPGLSAKVTLPFQRDTGMGVLSGVWPDCTPELAGGQVIAKLESPSDYCCKMSGQPVDEGSALSVFRRPSRLHRARRRPRSGCRPNFGIVSARAWIALHFCSRWMTIQRPETLWRPPDCHPAGANCKAGFPSR